MLRKFCGLANENIISWLYEETQRKSSKGVKRKNLKEITANNNIVRALVSFRDLDTSEKEQ